VTTINLNLQGFLSSLPYFLSSFFFLLRLLFCLWNESISFEAEKSFEFVRSPHKIPLGIRAGMKGKEWVSEMWMNDLQGGISGQGTRTVHMQSSSKTFTLRLILITAPFSLLPFSLISFKPAVRETEKTSESFKRKGLHQRHLRITCGWVEFEKGKWETIWTAPKYLHCS